MFVFPNCIYYMVHYGFGEICGKKYTPKWSLYCRWSRFDLYYDRYAISGAIILTYLAIVAIIKLVNVFYYVFSFFICINFSLIRFLEQVLQKIIKGESNRFLKFRPYNVHCFCCRHSHNSLGWRAFSRKYFTFQKWIQKI